MTEGSAQYRSPAMLAILALISFTALYLSESWSPVLPVLGALIGISYVIYSRIPNKPPHSYVVRVIIFAIVIVLNSMRPNAEVVNMFDIRSMRWVGEISATELTLHFWLSPATKDRIGLSIVLSGVVFMSSCSTLDDRYLPLITPAYILFLLLALRLLLPSGMKFPLLKTIKTYAFLIFTLLALTLGGVHYVLLHTYRNEIMSAVMKQVGDRMQGDGNDLNLRSGLGSRFGQSGSTGRALLIEGAGSFTHMRAAAYDTYTGGNWQPNPGQRSYAPLVQSPLPKQTKSFRLQITRFFDNNGIIFLPLNSLAVVLPSKGDIEWSEDSGGPVKSDAGSSSSFECTIGDEERTQGFLCAPPTGETRNMYLETPPALDSRVKDLAHQIADKYKTSQAKVDAIQTYLLANYQYSLSIDVAAKEPLTEFLFVKKAAHCEYFGTAMTILARYAGVPSRYVVGYYAHESEVPGITVVRQRDAHAWSECYVEGTGWITVDATPGSGRPDQLYSAPPFWATLSEKWQDIIANLKRWFQKTDKVKLVFLAIVIGSLFILVQFLLHRKKSVAVSLKPFEYSSPEETIRRIYLEFEALCYQRKLICPPMKTWSEHLEIQRQEIFDNAGLCRENLLKFLGSYNALRFGGDATEPLIQNLKNSLSEMKMEVVRKENESGKR